MKRSELESKFLEIRRSLADGIQANPQKGFYSGLGLGALMMLLFIKGVLISMVLIIGVVAAVIYFLAEKSDGQEEVVGNSESSHISPEN